MQFLALSNRFYPPLGFPVVPAVWKRCRKKPSICQVHKPSICSCQVHRRGRGTDRTKGGYFVNVLAILGRLAHNSRCCWYHCGKSIRVEPSIVCVCENVVRAKLGDFVSLWYHERVFRHFWESHICVLFYYGTVAHRWHYHCQAWLWAAVWSKFPIQYSCCRNSSGKDVKCCLWTLIPVMCVEFQ